MSTYVQNLMESTKKAPEQVSLARLPNTGKTYKNQLYVCNVTTNRN